MKIRIVTLAAAVCALATACSQTNDPEPTTTVTVNTTASKIPVSTPSSPARSPTDASATNTAPGADGSTGNDVSPEHCAQNEDPGCPAGSYVGPNAIPNPNPNGDGSYVPCEGTICTNPGHGAGTDPADTGDVAPDPDQNIESP